MGCSIFCPKWKSVKEVYSAEKGKTFLTAAAIPGSPSVLAFGGCLKAFKYSVKTQLKASSVSRLSKE